VKASNGDLEYQIIKGTQNASFIINGPLK